MVFKPPTSFLLVFPTTLISRTGGQALRGRNGTESSSKETKRQSDDLKGLKLLRKWKLELTGGNFKEHH